MTANSIETADLPLKNYSCTFVAKKRGAIGNSDNFSRLIIATSQDAATRELYKTFDHIQGLQIREVQSASPY